MRFDAVVLGGGFYGVKVALALHDVGMSVAIVEPGRLLAAATTVNQARVHSGLHYPRFLATATSAAKHYRRFITEHATVIRPSMRHLYAIAQGSKVTPEEFERVAQEIGAPITPLNTPNFFDKSMVQQVYQVEEVAFDISAITRMLKTQLEIAGIPVIPGHGQITSVDENRAIVVVNLGQPGYRTIDAGYVFNCTYANIDKVVPLKTRIKKEWVEVCVCQAPPELVQTDVTIMDGPFWSLMRHPGTGYHALTHVTHTPHHEWFGGESPLPLSRESWFDRMRDDAARFVPGMHQTQYEHSLWTTRVVLAQNESDDGRPILWEYSDVSPRVISILGSKFNSVYDAVDAIHRGEWMRPARKTGVMYVNRRALVGRGLVGRNIDEPGRFTDRAFSTQPLTPGHYSQIICAAPSGTKWKAEADPAKDMEEVNKLVAMLSKCTADEFILLGTIDALCCRPQHKVPTTAYGLHRQWFEDWLRGRYPKLRILRLPALFGVGLKKNLLYDLLHPELHKNVRGNPDSTYQWYPLDRLWRDIQEMREADVREQNIVTEPISVRWMLENLFPGVTVPSGPLVTYDVRSQYGYVMPDAEVKAALRAFVEGECTT